MFVTFAFWCSAMVSALVMGALAVFAPLVVLAVAAVAVVGLGLATYRLPPRRLPSLSAFADEQREKALMRDRAARLHDFDQH